MNDYYKVGWNVLIIFLITLLVLFLPLIIILQNKSKCEEKGGTYIFELGNQGSSCHFKVEAK